MDRRSPVAPLDARLRRRHKMRNLAQSVLLLGGLFALLGMCAWIVAGGEGVMWTLVAGGIGLLLSPRISPRLILRMYRAREIGAYDLPEVFEILEALCRRAGLERVPGLFYVPSATLNAFAVGGRDDAAIAVTDGMLRALNLRELAGVLAHEVSHIRNNDLWIMNVADAVSRLTGLMSYAGMFLLIANLPLLLTGAATFSWLLIALLMFAPTISSLLQLALSRAREFDADLDAAGLTGDPAALASALGKIERYQGSFWEEIFMPGRRIPEPSLLRTHPPTEERIRRLMSLYAPEPYIRIGGEPELALPGHFARIMGRPRWRATGAWF